MYSVKNEKIHNFKLSDKFISLYKNKKPNWGPLGEFTYLRTYSRKIEKENRNEMWYETVRRVVEGTYQIQKEHCFSLTLPWDNAKSQKSAQIMYDKIFNFKFLPPGRGLWMMGSDYIKEKTGAGLFNCAFISTKDIDLKLSRSFTWTMDALMLGVGVGFDTKGADKISIKEPVLTDENYIISDDREGWVESVRIILDSFFMNKNHKIPIFNYSEIRPEGSLIKGFGGTASGPKPLIKLHENLKKLLYRRVNQKIQSTDIVDIMNLIGVCVVAGNVRRSAELCLGSDKDINYITMKDYKKHPKEVLNHRWASNNSILAEVGKTDYNNIVDSINLNGEPGLVWLDNIKKYGRLKDSERYVDNKAEGTNPCLPNWIKILTPEGIRELKDISIGDKIWSKEGWTTVINKWKTGIKPVYKYETTSNIFYGTENHKIVSKGNKILIDEAESMENILGCIPENITIDPQDVMDGLVIGDGFIHEVSNNSIILYIEENNQDYFNSEIKDLIIKSKFGNSNIVYEVKTTILENELLKTDERKIPKRFMSSPKKIIGFLRGLYSANGSVSNNRITLNSCSKQIIEDVQLMLNSIGIRSYYTTNKPSIVRLNNGDYICKENYDLNISVDRDLFLKNIGFIQSYKEDKIKKVINSSRKKEYTIINKSFISEEDVFDITVDNKSHTFWSQGCNVSNCGEQSLENAELCCVSGDTKIQTKTGVYPIKEKVNSEVEVWNGEEWSKVTPFIAGQNKDLYRIYISDGSYIDCTEDHKWNVKPKTKKIFREVETKDLEIGSKVECFNINMPIDGKKESLAFEYGLFSGDGYIDKHSKLPMLIICGEKIKIKNLSIKGKWWTPQIKEGYKDPINRISFKGVLDYKKCLELNNKSNGLPKWIFEMDKESILNFLSGLIETDGNCHHGKNTDNYRIFGNEEKIRDLQLLVRRIGINHSSVNLYGEKGEKTNFGIRNYSIYCLYIPSFECGNIPTKIKKANKIGERYKKNNAYNYGEKIDSARKQKIVKIEKLEGKHTTYCFTELKKHKGVFGNVLTFQCLTETFPSLHESWEEYKETLKYAYLYGKTVTLVNTHWPETNQIMMKNRRIGLSQSGIIDAFGKHGRRNMMNWCDDGYNYVKDLDKIYSDWLCIPKSIKITSIKPSGTVSCLPGVSPGIHYPHSKYYYRTIRIDSFHPLVDIMKKSGYRVEFSIQNEKTSIIYFAVKEKNFVKSKKEVTVWEQIKNLVDYQENWADNNVSITVTFNKNEAKDIVTILESYEDKLKSISFLPYVDHGYEQAPYQEITEKEYENYVKKLKPVDFSSFFSNPSGEKFCDGDKCII